MAIQQLMSTILNFKDSKWVLGKAHVGLPNVVYKDHSSKLLSLKKPVSVYVFWRQKTTDGQHNGR